MKIAVVTAGAIGTFFGGRMAWQDVDIRFLAGGNHLKALQDQGLTIRTQKGEELVPAVRFAATGNPKEAVKDADLVIFAVKSFDTVKAARAILPGLGAATPVLTLQNGVENETLLSSILGPERTAAGVAHLYARLEGPGRVYVPSSDPRIVIGANTFDGQPLPHLAELVHLFSLAGISREVTPAIMRAKWAKLVFNTAHNAWTAVRRTTLDKVLANPETRPAFVATIEESVAVAKAAGINLELDIVTKTLDYAVLLGAVGSSMLSDLEDGKPLELEALNGYIIRRGRELGVPTPVNERLYRILSAYANPS